ncbi:MAG: hypothetical protein FD180_2239 [Planctomycetota bacterium]|nr:MAG: hypothetical protein FD180_2239 [Planctomycetota bacterium]
MRYPCLLCGRSLGYEVVDMKVLQCPGCGNHLVSTMLEGLAVLPSCVSPAELQGVEPFKLSKRIQELFDERGCGLASHFRGLPSEREARAEAEKNAARTSWAGVMWFPPLADMWAGLEPQLEEIHPVEGRDYEYAHRLGWDKEGRLIWQDWPYAKLFESYEYSGATPVRRLRYDEGRPVEIERIVSPLFSERLTRNSLSIPVRTRLCWKRGLLDSAAEILAGEILETREYRRRRGQLVEVRVKTLRKIVGHPLAWQPIFFEAAKKREVIDAVRRSDVRKVPRTEPRYLVEGGEGSELGRFGEAPAHVHLPSCPGCGNPMRCLLWVDPVAVLWCDACSYPVDRTCDERAWFVDHRDPGNPKAFSLRRHKKSRPEDGGDRLQPKPCAAVLADPTPLVKDQCVEKLGGSPLWVQSEDWQSCPRCQKLMSFWGQIGPSAAAGFEWGDAGVIYTFWCEKCRVTASTIQCF